MAFYVGKINNNIINNYINNKQQQIFVKKLVITVDIDIKSTAFSLNEIINIRG